RPAPSSALPVAFTAAGLEAIGIRRAIVDGFSREFLGGMENSNRARRLGDILANDPSVWEWGDGGKAPHVVVMCLAHAREAAGLEAIGIPRAIVDGFSPEFLGGMENSNRARRLGDIFANDPSGWDWGYGAKAPHLVVMFFANPKELAGFIQTSKGNAWADAFEEIHWLGTADLDGVEPFGFTDGISQPEIDWAQTRDVNTPQLDYTNIVALGEFLLGYR